MYKNVFSKVTGLFDEYITTVHVYRPNLFLLFIKRDLFTTIIKVLNMNIVTYTLKKTHN